MANTEEEYMEFVENYECKVICPKCGKCEVKEPNHIDNDSDAWIFFCTCGCRFEVKWENGMQVTPYPQGLLPSDDPVEEAECQLYHDALAEHLEQQRLREIETFRNSVW